MREMSVKHSVVQEKQGGSYSCILLLCVEIFSGLFGVFVFPFFFEGGKLDLSVVVYAFLKFVGLFVLCWPFVKTISYLREN